VSLFRAAVSQRGGARRRDARCKPQTHFGVRQNFFGATARTQIILCLHRSDPPDPFGRSLRGTLEIRTSDLLAHDRRTDARLIAIFYRPAPPLFRAQFPAAGETHSRRIGFLLDRRACTCSSRAKLARTTVA
jgi:hypothetical protein